MKNEGTVSMEIFSFVFGNYVQAGMLDKAEIDVLTQLCKFLSISTTSL